MRYKCNLLSCSSLCCLSCRFWAQAIVVLIKLSTGWLAEFDSLNLQFTCTLVRSVLRLYVVLRGACIQSTAHRSRLRLFGSTFAAPRNCDLQKLANVMSFDVAQLFCNCNVKNFFWLKLIFFCICPLSGIALLWLALPVSPQWLAKDIILPRLLLLLSIYAIIVAVVARCAFSCSCQSKELKFKYFHLFFSPIHFLVHFSFT